MRDFILELIYIIQLRELYGEIIIPEAVYRELSVKEESVSKKMVDASLEWIRVMEIENQMAKAMQMPKNMQNKYNGKNK